MNVSNNTIENKIKELNAIRAMYHRDFIEIEKKFNRNEISNKTYEKHKRKYDSKIGKVENKFRKLENKNEKTRREKKYLEWKKLKIKVINYLKSIGFENISHNSSQRQIFHNENVVVTVEELLNK